MYKVNKTIRTICLIILACCLFVSDGCGSKSTSPKASNREYKAYLATFTGMTASKNCVMAFVRHPKMTTEANEMMIVGSCFGSDSGTVFSSNELDSDRIKKYESEGVDTNAVKRALLPVPKGCEINSFMLDESNLTSSVDPDTSNLEFMVYKMNNVEKGKIDVIEMVPFSSILVQRGGRPIVR